MAAIVGIGNALVDILVSLPSDDFLARLGLPRGTMNLVDEERISVLLAETEGLPRTVASGGSAANTIHGLAGLRVSCAYIGKIGADETGRFFRDDLSTHHIDDRLFIDAASPTGRVLALISPDGERTFATHLGAAVHLKSEELVPPLFDGARFVHIEGFLVQDHALLRRAVSCARERGALVSLDLASHNIVRENLSFLQGLVAERLIDILFANEEEARAFTGKEPEVALDELASQCTITIIKRGKEGSIACRQSEKVSVPAVAAPCRDTTGAGDLYAAGFLYGLLHNLTLERCAAVGSLLAARVICRIGAKLSAEDWRAIRREIAL